MKISKVLARINPKKRMSRRTKTTTVFSKSEEKIYAQLKQKHLSSDFKYVQKGIKQVIDKAGAFIGLVLSAPIILVSAAAIKLETKGPALFKQVRIGKDGKPFIIYKLRTMYNSPHQSVQDLVNSDDARLTKVGKKLRKYSIDEFPQFINILIGDMSLIGPRPCTKHNHIVRGTNKEYLKRYLVKPGASLSYNGVKYTDVDDSIRVDVDYVDNWSAKKDIKAFFHIIKNVITGNNC